MTLNLPPFTVDLIVQTKRFVYLKRSSRNLSRTLKIKKKTLKRYKNQCSQFLQVVFVSFFSLEGKFSVHIKLHRQISLYARWYPLGNGNKRAGMNSKWNKRLHMAEYNAKSTRDLLPQRLWVSVWQRLWMVIVQQTLYMTLMLFCQ